MFVYFPTRNTLAPRGGREGRRQLSTKPGTIVMRNPFTRWKATAPAETPEIADTAVDTSVTVQQADSAPVVSRDVAGSGALNTETAAEALISGGATRALFVSPEGDEGAAASVMVAREVADAGLRALLIDLTISGAVSRVMLDSATRPGITDLLASEASFTDAVHVDLYSDCHILPVGTVDPVRAMRSAERLPVIMRSLTNAYDVVLVECGATDAQGIRALVADSTEIMVSVIQQDEQTDATVAELRQRGFGRVTLVSPVQPDEPQTPARTAA